MADLPQKDTAAEGESNPPTSTDSSEQLLVKVPATIVHLIDKQRSVVLAYGDLEIIQLRQNDDVVAVLARIGEQIQWPLAKDEAAVKLDDSHYFFSLHVPSGADEDTGEIIAENDSERMLNYGVTIASKGQEGVLEKFDRILERHSSFSVQRVSNEVDGWWVAKETAPEDLDRDAKMREMVEENSAAYWTTLAPNVEEYSGCVARMIAAGSGQLIKGILWCGDVTVERLKWGNEFLRRRLGKREYSEISPEVMKRIQRVKKMTKMTEEVATGILSGVVKVTGYITSSIVNSEVGKKFFSLLPGEIILASLDGFNKVWDAVEVAGKNVISTTSVVTTELVSERYGEQAGKATNEGLDAAGHAIGTAWTIFKIRKAINPKSVIKPTNLAKAAAQANSPKTEPVVVNQS
ncbi:hypothetical protein Nepgr_015373 [Nepenthes gracilis]|uniref:Senescence domain-containing protein n=1 Tax=Nepenthes gracilis TaxID=150966 RepID=A0AAD3SN57_NEPGR|nr:hypothetical protein Nepgr_015373 [Nepenthes gracilis]